MRKVAVASSDATVASLAPLLGEIVEAHTVPDVTPELLADPADLAHAFVRAGRIKKHAAARAKIAQGALNAMVEPMLEHMRQNKWSTSAKVDGANVHRKVELFASPAEVEINGEAVHDHGALTAVIEALAEAEPQNNWDQLLPSKINGNTLAGTFREYLRNADFTIEQQMLPVEERLVIAGCPRELVAAAKITEKPTVNANGL